MRRILPHPVLSLILIVLWLMLAQHVTAGSVLMAIALAVSIPLFTSEFWPERPKVHSWGALIKFMPVFLWDVLVANLRVAWLIVNVGRTLRPYWLVIPLDLQNPHGITTLANVISLTPLILFLVLALICSSLLSSFISLSFYFFLNLFVLHPLPSSSSSSLVILMFSSHSFITSFCFFKFP